MIFYPVYKLPEWLATALWMLRKAGILQVREQGLYDLSNISSKRVSNFSSPAPKDGTQRGSGALPHALHCISGEAPELMEQELGFYNAE